MIPLLGRGSKPQPSDELSDNADGMSRRFNPTNLIKSLFGKKKSGTATAMSGGNDKLKQLIGSSKKDDYQYTSISVSNNAPVRRGDSVSNIAAKVYVLINRRIVEKNKEHKVEDKLYKSLEKTKEKRHKELLKAISSAKPAKVVEKKVDAEKIEKDSKAKADKEAAQRDKKLKEKGEKEAKEAKAQADKQVKKPETPAAAPKQPPAQAAKEATKKAEQEAVKETTKKAEQQAVKETTKKAEQEAVKETTKKAEQEAVKKTEQEAARKAKRVRREERARQNKPETATPAPKPTPTATPATPTVPPPAPTAAPIAAPVAAAAPAVSTATQVAVGVGLVAASSYSFAAGPLAESIASKESQASSPFPKDKGKKVRWKNNSDYNAYNKGTKGKTEDRVAYFDEKGESVIDFSQMTIAEYLKRAALPAGHKDKLFAVGRYQIIPETMGDLIKQLKIDPKTTYLNPATQDYLFSEGIIGQKRSTVKRYIEGDPKVSRDAALLSLAQEFASIGVPYDVYRGKVKVKKGDSYYSGVGGNKALHSAEEVGKALDEEKQKKSKEKTSTQVTPQVKVGDKVDFSSQEYADTVKSLKQNNASTVILNNNNVNVGVNKQGNTMVPPGNDSSRFVNGVRR